MKRITYLFLFCVSIMLSSCGGSDKKKFTKNAVDELIKKMSSVENFTIILHDMDVEEGSFSDKYFHVYKIIKEVPKKNTSDNSNDSNVFQLAKFEQDQTSTTSANTNDSTSQSSDSLTVIEPTGEAEFELKEEITQQMEVTEEYFFKNENNMGMEIASKTEGKVTKEVAPAGFNKYVGNKQYGHWKQGSDGNSFWAFYGKYAMMSTMFHMMAGPSIYRSHYTDYRSNYYGSGRAYYGRSANGGYAYGTRSSYMQKSRPNFYNRRASKSSWSSKSSSSSSSYKSTGSSSSTSRTGTGSMRSSGGGYGK